MNQIPTLALTCFISAGAGFWVMHSLTEDKPAPALPTTGEYGLSVSGTPQGLGAVDSTLDELASRISALEARGALVEADRVPAANSDSDLQADLASLRELLASFQSVEQAPPARFQNMVELAIEAREAREAEEREIRRATQREERMDRTMEKLTADLALDPTQSTQMRSILSARDAERDEFFRSMRDGVNQVDRASIRDLLTERSEAYNIKIQGVLTPQQFEQYGGIDLGRGGFGGGAPRSQDSGGGNRGGRRNNDV